MVLFDSQKVRLLTTSLGIRERRVGFVPFSCLPLSSYEPPIDTPLIVCLLLVLVILLSYFHSRLPVGPLYVG